MGNRIPFLILACALSGCTSQPIAKDLAVGLVQILLLPNLDLPEDCFGPAEVPSPDKRCMTKAEYDTARKKLKSSHENGTAAKRKNNDADLELSEVIPGVPASRPTIPCSEPGQINCTAAGDR
jgi:hypothetical protein